MPNTTRTNTPRANTTRGDETRTIRIGANATGTIATRFIAACAKTTFATTRPGRTPAVWRAAAALLVAALLGGCAAAGPLTPPEDLVLSNGTPRALAAAIEPGTRPDPLPAVLWGGVVIRHEIRENGTLLEIASYPLRRQQPETTRMTEGRFRAFIPEFIDPVDVRTGREVTILGPVVTSERTRIGEVELRIPVVEADQYHLWPDDHLQNRAPLRRESPVRFGIGIGIRV